MKKYISLLSLTAAFLMQSCERTDSVSEITEQKQQSIEIPNNKESSKNADGSSETNGSNNFKTGDDDEPKKDKQHWRIVQDTIW